MIHSITRWSLSLPECWFRCSLSRANGAQLHVLNIVCSLCLPSSPLGGKQPTNRRPLGVIGVIAPWNYPFHNVYNHIISGIFAGNAVVSKVSEYTCWSSRCGAAAAFAVAMVASISSCRQGDASSEGHS